MKNTLADRCYDINDAYQELFETVHKILSDGGNLAECSKPDFKWTVTDVMVDEYDGSVEVVLHRDCPREQADKILALGFQCIYESRPDYNPTRGVLWIDKNKNWCSIRPGNDENFKLWKLKSENQKLKSDIKHLLNMIDHSQFDVSDYENEL